MYLKPPPSRSCVLCLPSLKIDKTNEILFYILHTATLRRLFMGAGMAKHLHDGLYKDGQYLIRHCHGYASFIVI